MLCETFNPPASKARLAGATDRRERDASVGVRRPGSLEARGRARQGHQSWRQEELLHGWRRPRCVCVHQRGRHPLPRCGGPQARSGAVAKRRHPQGDEAGQYICPGPRPCDNSKGACRGQGASSYPSVLTAVGRTLYFTAADGVHGQELWRSDGTARGTRIVKDIVPGPGPSNPEALTNVGGTLFFSASDGTHTALWRTDGTAAGTTLVKEVEVQGPDVRREHPLLRRQRRSVAKRRHNLRDGADQAIPRRSRLRQRRLLAHGRGGHTLLHRQRRQPLRALAKRWHGGRNDAGERGGARDRTDPGRQHPLLTTLDYSNSWLWRSDGTEAGTVPVTSVGVSPEGDGPWPQLTYADGPVTSSATVPVGP